MLITGLYWFCVVAPLHGKYCDLHLSYVLAGQSLRFFCDDCDSAICSSCTDIEHREHQTGRLENAAVRSANILHQIVSLSESQVSLRL